MKVKVQVRVKGRRCGCCVWNRVGECGVHFCVFPHCVRERGKGAAEPEHREAAPRKEAE